MKIFEKLLEKKAIYEVVEKVDHYLLDLSPLKSFIKDHNIDITFNEEYLVNNLRKKIDRLQS